jgi:hypothetical protein
MKIVRLDTAYWPAGWFGHWCPGCNAPHEISVDTPNGSGAKWTFDGNMERPTFSPSINMRWGNRVPGQQANFKNGGQCHYFIRNGMIQFCGDCTHELAGKTISLPEIPADTYQTSQRLARANPQPGEPSP